MSAFADRFVDHLQRLDRAALAVLRRSLAHPLGSHAPAFPFVEAFVPGEHPDDARRRALYLAAGLYALNPRHRGGEPLGRAIAQQMRDRGSESLEKRFIALLGADAQSLPTLLRHAVQLLAADERGFDFAALLDDLSALLDERPSERRDRVRQRWARDFYRVVAAPDASPDDGAEPAAA